MLRANTAVFLSQIIAFIFKIFCQSFHSICTLDVSFLMVSGNRACKSSGEKCLEVPEKKESGTYNSCCSGTCNMQCKDTNCTWYESTFGKCA